MMDDGPSKMDSVMDTFYVLLFKNGGLTRKACNADFWMDSNTIKAKTH
jgi:hypothetical protein